MRDFYLKTKTLQRVKNFLWCLCRNCVPTRMRLIDKDIQCHVYMEKVLKALNIYFYIYQRLLRTERKWDFDLCYSNCWMINPLLPPYFFLSFLQVLNQDQDEVFSTILWSIWKCKNNQIWNHIEDSSDSICNRASYLLLGWRNAQ